MRENTSSPAFDDKKAGYLEELGDRLKETCNLKGTTYDICGMQTSGVSTKFEAC